MKRTLTMTLVALLSAISVVAQTEVAYKRFIATYLPLPDRLTLDTAYFGRQVRLAMHARDIMPWGDNVPEREFKHFVLPPRVADETLDDSRQQLQSELCSLVARLGMEDAVTEINHWCRAHADIRPTDSRTLSPSATLATGYGNTTETAVLLVAALRAVCIPARIVAVAPQQGVAATSTAVWAEAWVDGKWHSLEPCRPETALDLGRHRQQAARARLVHTFVFGQYDTDEKVIGRGPLLTELDLTASYAKASPKQEAAAAAIQQMRTDHDRRLASDDAQRQARETRMHNKRWRGNTPTIEAFLAGPWDTRMAHTLLQQLTEKDMHDVTLDVLHDNIYTQTASETLNDNQMCYVVNPRIEKESLTPYKWFLRKKLAHIDSIPELVRWCRDSITLVRGQNPQQLRQSPVATYTHRQADAIGKMLFFAAAARSLGWAVRINEDNGRLQWNDDYEWHTVPPLSWADIPNEY